MEETNSVLLAFLVYSHGLVDESVNKITRLCFFIDFRNVASLLLDLPYELVNWLEIA